MSVKTNGIAFKAGQDVKMQVPDSLRTVWSCIVKELKAVNSEFFLIELADLAHHFSYILQDWRRYVKHILIMGFRYNQRVVMGNWLGI